MEGVKHILYKTAQNKFYRRVWFVKSFWIGTSDGAGDQKFIYITNKIGRKFQLPVEGTSLVFCKGLIGAFKSLLGR